MTAELIAFPDLWTERPEGWPACACDCGRPAGVVGRTDRKRGLVAGTPTKYASIQCRIDMGERRRQAHPEQTGTRQCLRCRRTKRTADFQVYTKTNRWSNICRGCILEQRRARYPAPVKERVSKLPKYDKLKELVVDKGMTYREIGELYRVDKRSVYRAVRVKATARGEWPLVTHYQAVLKARRASRERGYSIKDGGMIREIVRAHVLASGKTRREWAEENGFKLPFIRDIFAKGYTNEPIIIPHAVRLLAAADEPIPVWMFERAKAWKTFSVDDLKPGWVLEGKDDGVSRRQSDEAASTFG